MRAHTGAYKYEHSHKRISLHTKLTRATQKTAWELRDRHMQTWRDNKSFLSPCLSRKKGTTWKDRVAFNEWMVRIVTCWSSQVVRPSGNSKMQFLYAAIYHDISIKKISALHVRNYKIIMMFAKLTTTAYIINLTWNWKNNEDIKLKIIIF